MTRTLTNHRWLTAAAALAALAVVFALSHGTTPAQAQTSPFVRAFNFGPVLVGPEQSFLFSYSNLFGARPVALRARFFNASTGDSLLEQTFMVPAGEALVLPPCIQCLSGAAVTSGPMPVVGVVELADPRPTPLVSLQIISQGRVVALADPRPTPLADPRPTP